MTEGSWMRQPDGTIVVRFNTVNYGQTPSSNAQMKWDIKALPVKLPDTFQPEYVSVSHEPSLLVFPGAPYIGTIISNNIINSEEFANCIAFHSNVRIHVFLSITYKDVFDIQRCTHYCAYLAPQSSTNKLGDQDGWVWNAANKFNSLD